MRVVQGAKAASLTWRTVQQDTSRRINSNLAVQVELHEWQLDCFADLLLLNV